MATCGRSRNRSRIASAIHCAAGVSRRGPRTGPAGRPRAGRAAAARDERPDLTTPHETTSAELDALQPAGPRPAADRGGRETDVGGSEDLGRLGEGDPVGRLPAWRQSVGVRRSPASAGFDVRSLDAFVRCATRRTMSPVVVEVEPPSLRRADPLRRRRRGARRCRRPPLLLRPAGALVVDRRCRDRLADRSRCRTAGRSPAPPRGRRGSPRSGGRTRRSRSRRGASLEFGPQPRRRRMPHFGQ